MAIRLSVSGVVALFLFACAQPSADADIETILKAHTDARGGAAAIENINSIQLEMTVVEPEFTVTGAYVATRDGWMRVDIFADGVRVFTEALGPDGGWQMFGDGAVEDLSQDGAQKLARGVASNIYGLHELGAHGYSLTLAGSATRNDNAFWEIEQTAPDGFSKHIFLDKRTHLVAREIKTSALHPDLDATEVRQETFHTDYRETAGVMFSEKSEKRNLDSGDIMQTVQITSRRVNKPVDPAQFLRPSSAK
jgi:hypothetical protein